MKSLHKTVYFVSVVFRREHCRLIIVRSLIIIGILLHDYLLLTLENRRWLTYFD